MLTLLDQLYNCGFDGDLSRWFLPEEWEGYRAAADNRERLGRRLAQALTGEERELLERLTDNALEAGEGERALSFRRGLALGLKLGAFASWAP